MINVNEVKAVIGTYKSQLYKNFYVVDFLIERGGNVFKIRYPYKTEVAAEKALCAIQNKKQQDLQKPDYRPYIWLMVESGAKQR